MLSIYRRIARHHVPMTLNAVKHFHSQFIESSATGEQVNCVSHRLICSKNNTKKIEKKTAAATHAACCVFIDRSIDRVLVRCWSFRFLRFISLTVLKRCRCPFESVRSQNYYIINLIDNTYSEMTLTLPTSRESDARAHSNSRTHNSRRRCNCSPFVEIKRLNCGFRIAQTIQRIIETKQKTFAIRFHWTVSARLTNVVFRFAIFSFASND